MRMIFVNLPVKDVPASRRFFGALGFTFNEQFSDESSACLVIEENIFAMLMHRDRFQGFINGQIADTATAVEVLNCLSCDSRAEVDDLLAKALANGGSEWKPVMDMGPMYGASFRDPDGHVWELAYMDMAAVEAGVPIEATA